ncbi:ABC transporter ATP-binding protein [Salinisphaera orenii]|uniref:Amino acid ABC transporter ATP-binding protein n=1 Tax=Salinisphaera orenii YIM 95161 TaxID=1051139 RepID=A0A423PK55_9GAMM|nr:ABC transporter ATP-binding protein [Salinisphaera halophila]ROO25977.1 amino acid ABC transporter ATP-binding protein [Salinisphaera halophila YIM 95161]
MNSSASAPDALLEARELSIRFGGHTAVDAVSCGFEIGTLTAIVGPNGAGKTTFFNLLSGQLAPTGGELIFDGQDITRTKAPRRAQMGIGRAFQLTNLFPELSVRENMWLAASARTGAGLAMHRLSSSYSAIADKVDHYLARVSLAKRADWLAATLPHGDQRKLEVGMLLALEPRVFMFDEPTAGMSVDEVPVILDLVEDIRAERDKVVLLVEHKMDVVRSLADRIIVLHEGRLLDSGEPAEVIASPLVQQAYLGEVVDPEDDTQRATESST